MRHKYVLPLCVVVLVAWIGVAPAQNADTVDGFDAYATPHSNALLALDGSKHFPISVIPDNSIPGGKLAYGAVTAGRLRDGAVTTSKLALGAVTAGRLADNSVTSSKITNGAIRGEDVGTPLVIGASKSGYLVGCFNSSSTDGATGICGYDLATSGQTRGVVGACQSPAGKGVHGIAKATTGTCLGVYGETASRDGIGVFGNNTSEHNRGYLGSPSYGVYGYHYGSGNEGYLASADRGAYGKCYSNDGAGVVGTCSKGSNAKGVWGYSTSGYGGYFTGDVFVLGNFYATYKWFRIDHPLDPENMYLQHACVESAEAKNVYDGTVVLDSRGEAWIALPDWFEALNCDFRYQLTPVGAPAPNLYVAQKIENGCFEIAGGVPGMEVSWQVTGVRQDPYALAHPLQVEVEKPEAERGYYLHPDVYGMPETLGVDWALDPKGMMEMSTQR
jgi:hypothetical protein